MHRNGEVVVASRLGINKRRAARFRDSIDGMQLVSGIEIW